MEILSGSEEGFVREWTPCSHILNLIPTRIQSGLFSNELCLTCVDAVSEYIALGTNIGLVYWYDRKTGTVKKLRCEATTSPITYVKIVNTVDYMVGAGNAAGQVTVFQIPKEHPENVPEAFKPKEEPKVERYTIGDLHKSQITAIEWSKNGMRLISGDKNGIIIMTELDFYMHLCKSMEIVNEEYEIIQMSYYQNTLLVSSLYRTIVCEKKDNKWQVSQLGKKERKSLCRLGAVFQYSYARGGAAVAFCARQGQRLWRADKDGNVLHTLLFKDAISNPITVAELLNPSQKKRSHDDQEYNFGPIHVFKEHFLVTHNEHFLYILDPRSLTAVAVVDDLRRILSVSVNKDEIFVLEGPRSLVRLAHTPEPASLMQEDPINLMTKSLTTSLHQAVNTVRNLTQNQTVPFIASVLEQPLNLFSKSDTEVVVCAEECFELPPIRHLPNDMSNNVLESIVNEFKGTSNDLEDTRRIKSEEFDKKLKLYNSIIEKKQDDELIYSRRGRKKDIGSGGSTPRTATPVRKPDISYTSPCLMNVSVYGNLPLNDEQLEKEIEEKEKLLAKMLNLESLSIKYPNIHTGPVEDDYKPVKPTYTKQFDETIEPEQETDKIDKIKPKLTENPQQKLQNNVSKSNADELVPKLVKIPINWNLDINVKPDSLSNGTRANSVTSPDDTIENDWEII